MGKTMAWLAALAVAAGMTGCAAVTPKGTCASCVDGVTYVNKSVERHAFCVVNGKQVDCTKTPAECPGCKK